MLRARVASARPEAGFALIEVMVSAALLSVVAIGVYAGVDGPTALSGADRLRSQAAGIAQQDQERLKSLGFDDLQSYSAAPRQVTLGANTFTVASTTRWISDQTGTDSCTNSSATVDYLAVTSSVTWPALGGGTPVAMRSVVAPPTGTGTNLRGNLSVQVTDQAGGPVPNLPVSISGPASRSATTNSEGCAVFAYIPTGDYTATFSRSGWVDPTGAATVTKSGTVTGNNTTVVPAQYAQAAGIDVKFIDSDNNPARWTSASVIASQMSAPAVSRTTPSGTFADTISTGYTLFPYTGGYKGWGGACPDPTKTTATPGGYSVINGYTVPSDNALVTPGQVTTLTARLPTMRLTITRGGSAIPANKQVEVTVAPVQPVTPACADVGPTPTTPTVTTIKTAATGGGNVDIPLPYGDWTVCADDGPWQPAGSTRRNRFGTVANRIATGTAPRRVIDISTSSTINRLCP